MNGRIPEQFRYLARSTWRRRQVKARWAFHRSVAIFIFLLALTGFTGASFILSDPDSEVYSQFAAVAGKEIWVDSGGEVTGNLHSNDRLSLLRETFVDGDVSVVGRIRNRGTVTGTVTRRADPLLLPGLLTEEEMRALADRIFEDDTTFVDEVIDDVVFVHGVVTIEGDFNGTGTVLALCDIRFGNHGQNPNDTCGDDDDSDSGSDSDSDSDGGSDSDSDRGRAYDYDEKGFGDSDSDSDSDHDPDEPPPFFLDDNTRLSLISLQDIRFDRRRHFRGVARAGRNINLAKYMDFEGVLVADRRIRVRSDASVRFADPDQTSPVIELVSPLDGSVIDESPSEIVATWSDDSGLDLATAGILLDGADRTADAVLTDAGLTLTLAETLDDGLHTVEITISDLGGNVGTGMFSFEISASDREPPVVTILEPDDGTVTTLGGATVTAAVSDESPIISVTIDGEPAVMMDGNYTAVIFLDEGANLVEVEALDEAGNTGTASITVTVVEDLDAPEIRIVTPSEGVFVTDPQPTIQVTYDDPETGIDTTSLELAVAGVPISANCDVQPLTATCTPTAPFGGGAIDLRVSIADLAGNVNFAETSFNVDLAGIEVEITDPENGFVTGDETIVVTGLVGAGVTEVVVDEIPATLSGGQFTATVDLREGTQQVVALATKANGNSATSSIEVVRDIVAPIVTITTPRDGFAATSNRVTVTGQVNDIVTGGADARVLVNGIEATVGGGSFMVVDVPLLRGPNPIEAVATDLIGNEGSDAITVNFNPPVGDRLIEVSGDGQRAVIRETLAEPLVVQVTDRLGNPVAGKAVRFAVSRNSGTLRAQAGDDPVRLLQVATGGDGLAQVLFTLGDTSGEGNNRVRVTSVGVDGELELCASALPAAPDKILMISGDNQRALVDHPLPMPLEAMVVDADGNPLAGVDVEFSVAEGGGSLDGQAQQVKPTGIDGVARAVFKIGPDEGINNNVAVATFAGHDGLEASYTASGLAGGDPAQTTFSGVVLDNAQVPIPGATVSVDDSSATGITDAEGRFLLTGVPPGHIHLVIDPTTSPRPEIFPPLEFETVTVAGRENDLGQPILIPAITGGAAVVGGSEDVTIFMPGVEGLSLTVKAGSATFPDGSPTGVLSISQVHFDKVPMAPPNGSIFMPPSWTIQPAGVKFDPPAPISIPNDGLPAGRVIDIFQFDHTLNEFINVGKGTVSEDEAIISSDEGFGITRTGWGGCGLPQPPPTCPSSCSDGNACTRDFCRNGKCRHEPKFPDGCSDGRICTHSDRCVNGRCKGTPFSRGIPCDGSGTEEACRNSICDGRGNCLRGLPKPDGTSCNDLIFCTDPDVCQGGTCQGEECEDGFCPPVIDTQIIVIPALDFLFFETPGFESDYNRNFQIRKKCCEDKLQKETIFSTGSGTFMGEAPLDVAVPIAGSLAKRIKTILCGKILKLPFLKKVAKCDVGITIKAANDGISVNGNLGGTIDECQMTKRYTGGGSISANSLGIFGEISVSLLPTEDDDEDDFLTFSGTVSGSVNFSGEIEAADDVLLITLQASDLTFAASLGIPGIPLPPLSGTIPGASGIGPLIIQGPGIPTDCP